MSASRMSSSSVVLAGMITLLAATAVASAGPAAGWRPRVVDILGDPRATTCLVPAGERLWVGSSGAGLLGLGAGRPTRLDARHGLPGNAVTGCRMHRGELWVATEQGLARLDARTGRFVRLARGRFLALAAAGDRLLAARADGSLLAVEAGAGPALLRRLELTPAVLAVAADGRWAAADRGGQLALAGGRGVLRLPAPAIGLAFAGEELVALTMAGGWRVRGGVLQAEPALRGAVGLSDDGAPVFTPGLEHLEVAAVGVWQGAALAATDEGVFRRGGRGWEELDLGGMPCGNRVSALAELAGALWVGSFDRGVCRWDGQSWQRFTAPRDLPAEMVNDMVSDGTQLYVATVHGLAVADGQGRFRQYSHRQCMGNLRRSCPWFPAVTGVAVDGLRGEVWAADNGSLHRVAAPRWQHLGDVHGIRSRRITRVAARDGQLALGTADMGVLLAGPGHSFVVHDDQHGLADDWVMDLTFAGDGSLWVATCTRGVSRYREGHWESYSTQHGLTDDYTLSVAEIDGRLWVGTLSGLTIFASEPGRTPPLRLDAGDGLGGNEIHDILRVGDRVYLATEAGVTVLAVD